ncbi:MAG: glucose-6-phosphate dehydrogenase [Phycisphaerales bacterium]|nr:MAG: glucose-6-phosphate dehydrogenase [Phycisphaerales bacterium]
MTLSSDRATAHVTDRPEPCVIVIFGASGDLTSRKLIPALYETSRAGQLPQGTRVLGISRTEMSDAAWRDTLESWAREHATGFDEEAWRTFAQCLHYFPGSGTDESIYGRLKERIEQLARDGNQRGNVLFYLSVAPSLYESIIERIGGAELVHEGKRWCSLNPEAMPWQRIIVEKPFGHDARSAQSLNRALGRVFEEEAIYRIDHYLAKELVQNLLVLRFGNTIFEPIWNHRYIDHVQITASESVGVGSRGAYYDEAGAIRDMIQSHLLQILALVAMDAPTRYAAHEIRQEKIKIINSIAPTPEDRIDEFAALGQYAGDDGEPAYHELPDVPDTTTTETFAALALRIDNWRWAGTPFYLRTGKRLAQKRTEIVIEFKRPPIDLFQHLQPSNDGASRSPNRIIIEIAPTERVGVQFQGKVPGPGIQLDTVRMDFDYQQRFHAEPVEAYGPLLLDAMRGDQTLYKHRLEVEGAWDSMMPFLNDPSASIRQNIQANYAPGSWGPESADALLARQNRQWHRSESRP